MMELRSIRSTFQPTHVALPPVEPESSHRGIRYERGSAIYATDGPVGTLRQIVIDEGGADVKALVVRMAAKNESVLVPPDLVDKSVGGALLLTVTKEQFALGASRTPRMEASMFTGASLKTVAGAIPLVFGGDPRRSVINLSANHVATGAALEAPVDAQPSPGRLPWRKLLRRMKHANITGSAGWRSTSVPRQA